MIAKPDWIIFIIFYNLCYCLPTNIFCFI